jgi:hypothetical protein
MEIPKINPYKLIYLSISETIFVMHSDFNHVEMFGLNREN